MDHAGDVAHPAHPGSLAAPGSVAQAGSVAPPGWSAPTAGVTAATAVAVPLAVTLPAADRPAYLAPGAGATAADAAIRWRLRAATIDNFIVWAGFVAFCLVIGWNPLTLPHLLVEGLFSIAYHFWFEFRTGQTPGKRRYGIQVLDADGGPAGAKAVALRSVLRIIDQLPVWYVSGLVSMVRTGPHRRQRIGDVAGHTTVVAVGGRAASRGTPGWYLPVATLAAVLMSALAAWGVVYARSAPLSSTQQAEFITSCQMNSPGVDCVCLLRQLQAEGYVSLTSLESLIASAEAAVTDGRPAAIPAPLLNAVRVCRA